MTEHIGNSFVILGYNGRDGVVTDRNGLLYMRARYYSPEMRRFINADILHGEISDSTSLNRYSYVNGNPVSFVDPFGLSAERESNEPSAIITAEWEKFLDEYFAGKTTLEVFINEDMRKALYQSMRNAVLNAKRPNNIGKGTWAKQVAKDLDWIDDVLGKSSPLAKGLKAAPWVGVGLDASIGLYENIQNAQPVQEILTDAALDVGFGALGVGISSAGASLATILATSALSGTAIGTAVPGLGNVIGAVGGILVGLGYYALTEVVKINGKSVTEWLDEWF